MKRLLENETYDTEVEPLDWRYSAAIVGLQKYLQYYGTEGSTYEITDDVLRFNSSDITEEKYLRFVEEYYGESFHHKKLENLLCRDEFSKEQMELANNLLKKNAISKKIFGKVEFDGTNKKEILELIEKNRDLLIKETYCNKYFNFYANFANEKQIFKEGKNCCRLRGYYVDGGRKSKAIAYNFDGNTYVCQDDSIFDFIPFAFTGERESFFINDSFSVKRLIHTNETFSKKFHFDMESSGNQKKDARKTLFKAIQRTADFLDYDVEVIRKNSNQSFYETMFIREESIDILRDLQEKEYDSICFSFKVMDNYYIDVQKEVTNCILNLIRIDEWIEMFLRQKSQHLVGVLIEINRLICGGGEQMKRKMYRAKECAEIVAKKIPENKCDSYRQKLLSSIIFKDYNRCCEVLLQLSNYSEVPFDFSYDLFEDFEGNKDIAYTFVNALVKKKDETDKKTGED